MARVHTGQPIPVYTPTRSLVHLAPTPSNLITPDNLTQHSQSKSRAMVRGDSHDASLVLMVWQHCCEGGGEWVGVWAWCAPSSPSSVPSTEFRTLAWESSNVGWTPNSRLGLTYSCEIASILSSQKNRRIWLASLLLSSSALVVPLQNLGNVCNPWDAIQVSLFNAIWSAPKAESPGLALSLLEVSCHFGWEYKCHALGAIAPPPPPSRRTGTNGAQALGWLVS